MRIIYILIACIVVDTNAYAFSSSKLELSGLKICRNRPNVVAANHQHSSRLNEVAVADERFVTVVDATTSPGRMWQTVGITALLATIVMATTIVGPAFADEYGVEKEAPTLFTGETVEVCTNVAMTQFRSLKLLRFAFFILIECRLDMHQTRTTRCLFENRNAYHRKR